MQTQKLLLLQLTEHMLEAHTVIDTNSMNNPESFAFYYVHLKLF